MNNKNMIVTIVMLIIGGVIGYKAYNFAADNGWVGGGSKSDVVKAEGKVSSADDGGGTMPVNSGMEETIAEENSSDENSSDESSAVENSSDKTGGDTPDLTAIVAGSDGGKWQTMESGETAYVYGGDKHASSVWIKDGSKVYYVDPLGCRMPNNYAHDGYYAGVDGSWDRSKGRITDNRFPHNSVKYTDETSNYVVFSIFNNDQGVPTGTAKFYTSDSNEGDVFNVKYLGHSTFLLTYINDVYNRIHMAVVDGSQTIIMSCAGETHVLHVKN